MTESSRRGGQPDELPNQIEDIGPGLTSALLWESVSEGDAARARATAHHPFCAPGFFAWAEVVRALRDRLCALDAGWEARDIDSSPCVVHAATQVAIRVSSGNPSTGVEGSGVPQPANPKGLAAIHAVASNCRQLHLQFDLPDAFAHLRMGDGQWCTWYLLYQEEGDELRAELSLPTAIDASGQPTGMAIRFFIEPEDGAPPPARGALPTPDPAEFDIDVKRRNA